MNTPRLLPTVYLTFYITLSVLLFAGVPALHAATVTVPGTFSTIQSAINAVSSGDTVLVSDGTYTGPGNVDLDFHGKDITVKSVHGAASTIINCNGSPGANHRGFYLHSNEPRTATIDGFTVKNGYVDDDGGGIYADGATVVNCTISGNVSGGSGGGIFSRIQLLVKNCIVSENSSVIAGGGIFAQVGNIDSCTLIANTCTAGSGYGGGVYSEIALYATNCAFLGNTANAGGGIYANGTNGRIVNCTSYGDTAGSGSGLVLNGSVGIVNCIFWAGQNSPEIQLLDSTGIPTITYSDVQGGWPGTGNINTDPLFYSYFGDLHLIPTSPCLGAGTTANAPATDADGKMRPAHPSMGAYDMDWTAVAVSVGSDNRTRLLWDKVGGSANIWTITPSGGVSSTPIFGPFLGWTASALATDRANNSRLLWNSVAGQASLWSVSPDGTASSIPGFGPYSGWTASALSVGADGRARLAWNNSGQAALWIVNSTGGADNTSNYGPYSGWHIQSLATGPDTNTRVLWDKADGTASLWGVTPAGRIGANPPTYGPYQFWTAKAIASAPDNRTWVLWAKTDGTATLWIVNGTGGVDSSHNFGPYAGWTATSLAVGPDGTARLLWDKSDGTANVWTVTPSFGVTSTPFYGPY